MPTVTFENSRPGQEPAQWDIIQYELLWADVRYGEHSDDVIFPRPRFMDEQHLHCSPQSDQKCSKHLFTTLTENKQSV